MKQPSFLLGTAVLCQLGSDGIALGLLGAPQPKCVLPVKRVDVIVVSQGELVRDSAVKVQQRSSQGGNLRRRLLHLLGVLVEEDVVLS